MNLISTPEAPIEIDLGNCSKEELSSTNLAGPVVIFLPLPSFGHSNSYIDLCSDLIDASWAAEQLARCAVRNEVENDYIKERHCTRIKLTLHQPQLFLRDIIADCLLIFQYEDDLEQSDIDHQQSLRLAIEDYEEAIDTFSSPFAPEIIDWYHANLVNGAYYEYQSDAPDYYLEQIRKNPERQVGFYKSAFSDRLEAEIYTSLDSWVTAISVHPDHFFQVTGQPYQLMDFIVGNVFMIDGKSLALANGDALHFPMSQYFKSRVCMSLRHKPAEDWPEDRFAWSNAAFTYSPYSESLRNTLPPDFRSPFLIEKCLVHRSGSMIVMEDDNHRHFLYDTQFLSEPEVMQLHERIGELSYAIARSARISPQNKLDWADFNDETFECLCYDLIAVNPRFDVETIRKMGKSRSRDGGRDIVVHERMLSPSAPPRKWIFQCKLIRNNSSLSATRLTDVGDMLDQYDAQGFSVMTSAPIDATLYDKLDAICRKRGVDQMHYSIFELEHTLNRYPGVRNKYFPNMT